MNMSFDSSKNKNIVKTKDNRNIRTNKLFKWLIVAILLFSLIIYICFAIIPEKTGFSLPTGGWDWLGYIGVIAVLIITGWGVIKSINENSIQNERNRELEIVPCLNVISYEKVKDNAYNKVFRKIEDEKGILINDGYILLRDDSKKQPDDFTEKSNIKVTNLGLSTAFAIETYLYKLNSVEGISILNNIISTPIADFYDKIDIEKYCYLEDGKILNKDWLISPVYNLNNISSEFNLVFDLSNIKGEYYSIIEFRYSDIYENKYYQYLYWYFDGSTCATLPLSKIYKNKK